MYLMLTMTDTANAIGKTEETIDITLRSKHATYNTLVDSKATFCLSVVWTKE